MAALYALLSLGALTTLYPFLLMASTGFKGNTDQNDNKLVPAFWRDEDALLDKYIQDKYAQDLSQIASTRIGSGASQESVQAYKAVLEQLPPDTWVAGFVTPSNNVTGKLALRYQAWLRSKFGSIDALNRAYIDENVAFQTVAPPVELLERRDWRPPNDRKWADWLEFKAQLPAEFRLPIRRERLFQEFLRSQHQNNLAAVPPELIGDAKAFEEIRLPSAHPILAEFEERMPEALRRDGVERRWAEVGTGPLPIAALETAHVQKNRGELRREFTTRNYRYILDYILINGRAVWVTLAFCLFMIAGQLIVNPLAAYALSRHPIKASGKILVFLLATMAFPAEVAMIPSFLLLKDLGLLNTFAALVLPALASGYMIFLLKGFFDSLPQELFEAGQIDGARESTMMLRIALPLSKPVLGYLALLAFMAAYGSFLYAFLVAQDQRMWTLMVWIYQLQLVAPRSVMMAALTLAALPTLLVFLFAQRVIMRGIVLPGER